MSGAASSTTTLALIKPDAVGANVVAQIEAMIAGANFGILARMEAHLSPSQATKLFASQQGSANFDDLIQFMCSGPIVALALSRADCVSGLLELLGPEDSKAAASSAPGSVRALFGTDALRNAAHGSATPAAALAELKLFFPKTFPRELTVALLAAKPAGGDASAASSSADLEGASKVVLKVAGVHDFLCVASSTLTLTPAQASKYKSYQPTCDEGALTAGPVRALLLERPFATEELLSLCASGGELGAGSGHGLFGGGLLASSGCVLLASASPMSAAAEAALLFGHAAVRTPTQCLALVTPDAISRADEVLAQTEGAGFTLLASRVLTLSESDAAVVAPGCDPKTLSLLTGGPSLALALSRPCAPSAWASLLGPADPQQAVAEAPLSLRALFGSDSTSNGCRGSASDADARRDLALVFPSLCASSTTLGLLTPDAAPFVDEILEAAEKVGISVTARIDATLSHDRARDYLKLLGPTCPPPASASAAPAATGDPPPPPPPGSFESVLAHLTSGPSVVLRLSGIGALEQWSALLGPIDPLLAKIRCPGCLRAKLGVDATRAVGFGSLTAAAAEAELKFFFPKAALPELGKDAGKEFVATKINPTLSKGLIALCKAKPEKPVEWLAHWLSVNNPNK